MDWIFSTHLRFHEIFLETFIKQYYVVEQISRERVGAWKYLIMLLKKAPNLILRRIKKFFLIFTYYLIFSYRMYGLFQTTFYFGYMALFSLSLGLMCATLGYMGTSLFVRKIYSTVKIDWKNSQNWLKTKNLLAHYSDDIPWCFF